MVVMLSFDDLHGIADHTNVFRTHAHIEVRFVKVLDAGAKILSKSFPFSILSLHLGAIRQRTLLVMK
jgi:hypothetical protein